MKTRVYIRPLRPTVKNGKSKKTFGECNIATGEIWADPNQPESELLDTLIHEAIHIAMPHLKESRVIKCSNIISDVLWKKGYRRR